MTHEWYSILFGQTFGGAPRFVASIATYNGGNCALRYQNLAAGGVEVKVEEDTTWDSETSHNPEGVAYLAIEGDGLLTAEWAMPVGRRHGADRFLRSMPEARRPVLRTTDKDPRPLALRGFRVLREPFGRGGGGARHGEIRSRGTAVPTPGGLRQLQAVL